MNPATYIGKKSLPHNIRNRYSFLLKLIFKLLLLFISRLTEFYVDEVQDLSDLALLVRTYLQDLTPPSQLVDGIIT